MSFGFHVQNGVSNWLDAVGRLPGNTWIKIFSEQQGQEIKARGNYKVVRRHWYDHSQIFGGSFEENKQRARTFFNSFINETFRQYAKNIDAIEGWNEFVANSQNQQEVEDRIRWVQASQQVWTQEYRNQTELSHIKLCSVNAAIGNDIHWRMAKAVADNGGLLGYHPYLPVNIKLSTRPDGILPDEWEFYSGRWAFMDQNYVNRGIKVNWLFTESGPVLYKVNGGIHLDPIGGWRHKNACNGDPNKLLPILGYWLDRVKQWNSQNNNRALGAVLFTTGGGDQWKTFETRQPEMNIIADYVKNHTVVLPPTPPPPQPNPTYPHGTDISHWQGNINWQKMKSKNVKYVFMKASEGASFRDPRFTDNWKNAKEAGLYRGAYHFYRNGVNPITQAHLLMSQLNGDKGELPLVLDCEDTIGTVDKQELLGCLKEIENLSGRKPIIYTGKWWWNPKVGNVEWAKEYDLWIAQYVNVSQPSLPIGFNKWLFWQYSSSGNGAQYGVSSNRIDLNNFNGAQEDLKAYVSWKKTVYLFSKNMFGWDKILKIINDEILPNRYDITWSFDSAFSPAVGLGKHKVVVFHVNQWGGKVELQERVLAKYGVLPEIEYR